MSSQKQFPKCLLIISLVIVFCFSFLASMFNTGMFSVNVSRIKFDTENGTLSGLLYKPKTASAENPRPTVIVTHGYLNSAEMQDANAIELSRRGYIVLALDMYDHGHSNADEAAYGGSTEFFPLWSTFWVNSIYDAVQYMYDQPYVLKDEAGNGIIGVTGHSMGGYSSTMAVAKDEGDFASSGIRKIHANLTEGSDFGYSGIFGVTAEAFDVAAGGRVLGKVAAQFDEFFFNSANDPKGETVRHKNYVATPDGKIFLQQETPKADTWYETSDGGKRIIYQPYETHPWNHFSKTTTANAVRFYTIAFSAYNNGINNIDPNNQIWIFKELSECVALVGFVLFIIAIAGTIINLPFFSNAKTELPVKHHAIGGRRAIGAIVLIISLLLPAILFETMYNWNPESSGLNAIFWSAIVLTTLGLIFAISRYLATKEKHWIKAAGFSIFAGALLAILTKKPLYTNVAVWTAPTINNIAMWTVGATFISLLVMSLVYIFDKNRDDITLADYGVSLRPMVILSSLCVAVVTVIAAYILLFFVDLIFKTDFRIWTFAFKTFDANIFPAIFRYLPTFLAFYLVSTASITINTNTDKLGGIKGYLLAIAINAGGIILWLIRQYATLFSTGVAAHPAAALGGIVLVAMVPTLAIAACISRYLYKRTGNIWVAGFLNGLLMTIMAVANTTVFFK